MDQTGGKTIPLRGLRKKWETKGWIERIDQYAIYLISKELFR
jgi:hypothetical protein